MNVAALVVLFYIFHTQNLWRKLSGKDVDRTVKTALKIERLDYQLWKAQTDVEFFSDSSGIRTHKHLVPK